VSRRCDGKDCGSRPTKEQRDRMRENRADPAEVPPYVATPAELCVTLGRERAGEKNSEEKEDDPADLAGERGARGLIWPVPARAW
jgi:hypothetical protein